MLKLCIYSAIEKNKKIKTDALCVKTYKIHSRDCEKYSNQNTSELFFLSAGLMLISPGAQENINCWHFAAMIQIYAVKCIPPPSYMLFFLPGNSK